jgi:hypothetical protein
MKVAIVDWMDWIGVNINGSINDRLVSFSEQRAKVGVYSS